MKILEEKGTAGFNTRPDGEDSQIEFILAQIGPDGNQTDGIIRVNKNSVDPPTGVSDFLRFAPGNSQWNPEEYLNI